MPSVPSDPRLRRVLLDPRLIAYDWIAGPGSPLVAAYAKFRRWRRVRKGGRFDPVDRAAAPLPRPEGGPHVEFCGPGYGEFIMMERVAAALRRARPDVVVSYALRDPGTVDDLRSKRPNLRFVAWPELRLRATAHWLDAERPDLLVMTEQFRYPMLVCAAARYGARVALINGRCRPRRGLKYLLLAPFYRWQFGGFSAMAMQDDEYRRAAESFAPKGCDVLTSGDIKADLTRPDPRPDLDRWLPRDLPLVVAGSTETDEEERMVIAAFQTTRRAVPCRLLVAPRQPRDAEGLLRNLREAGLAVSRRSTDDGPAEVMVLDTLGELAAAYRSSRAAYVGGSYSAGGGGHNVMEPLLWGVPVAYGMRRGHFGALQRLCERHGVATRIANADDLAAFWKGFLRDDADRSRVGALGEALLEESRGAVRRTVETLLPLLEASTGPASRPRA